MKRYNPTERLGIIETDLIITRDVEWIFREQPVVDVGIDAILEQCDKGDPKGKFIAAQIKTGKSHFNISKNRLTYYVSHIHYNYWLNVEMPIILVAHIPETSKTYWEIINKTTLKRTNEKWKLEIPVKQELNESSKNRLTEIISERNQNSCIVDRYKRSMNEDDLYELTQNAKSIGLAGESVTRISELIKEIGLLASAKNIELSEFVNRGLSDKDHQVKASINRFAKDLHLLSQRLESEIILYAELFSEGIYAYSRVIYYYSVLTNDSEKANNAFDILKGIPLSVDIASEGISKLNTIVSNLPKKYNALNESQRLLGQTIQLILAEFAESKRMVDEIADGLVQIDI